jgi:hypothetical protein
MSQNLISLNLTDAALAEIDAALAVVEGHFAPFVTLAPAERRNLAKMGDKSEAFCRQTLMVLAQNPQVIPPSLDLAEAQADLAGLDKLRPRLHRLRDLLGKGEDTDMALGSDVYNACLDGYALLKIAGKGAGLETLRQAMSIRFSRNSKAKTDPAAPAGQ